MFLPDNNSVTISRPAKILPPGTPGWFASPGGTETILTSDWLNIVAAELTGVVTAAGLTLDKTNDAQLLQAIQALTRIKLTGNTILYVNPQTGNDANNGLSTSTPRKTLQSLWNMVVTTFDLAGYNLTIQSLATGNHGPLVINGMPAGWGAGNFVTFVGGGPGCQIVGSNQHAVACTNGQIFMGGWDLYATGTFSGFYAAGMAALINGFIGHGNPWGYSAYPWYPNSFYGCGTHHWANGGQIGIGNNYNIYDQGYYHNWVYNQGQIFPYGAPGSPYVCTLYNSVTTSVPPVFTYFSHAESGIITLGSAGLTFAGVGATGKRYYSRENGICATAGSGANYFPGNVAGTLINQGLYL